MTDTVQRHTRQPWETNEPITIKVCGYPIIAIPISGDGMSIGYVFCGSPRSAEIGIESNGPANARLMAAAPDMAAALQALKTVDRLNVAEWSAAMRAVDAALAKATGE